MTSDQTEAPAHLGYRPALDGARALAIGGVLMVHLHEDVFSLGAYGVDLFFVLSGFLITLLLVQEREGAGHIQFAKFYARRALRLLPVLYAALAVVVLHAVLTKSGGERTDMFVHVGFSAVYLKNWEVLFHATSEGGPLVHLWSLSLEEQFYLVWPPILALLLARGWLRAGRILAMCGFAILAATRLLALPDTTRLAGQRADALLLGCALGITWFLAGRRPTEVRTRWAAPVSAIALAALAAAMFLPLPWRTSEAVQRVGITLIAVLSGALICGVARDPSCGAARVLAFKPFVLIGRISYGLYVWHVIVFKLTPPKFLPGNQLLKDVALVALSFGVAIASFVVIERPALRLKARLRVGAEEGPSPDLLEPDESHRRQLH